MRQILGLTGGIGSGKSLVLQYFFELDCFTISLDQVAHNLTAPNGKAIAEIVNAFGADILLDQGGLDRSKMRALIAQDLQQQARLEQILHPLIRKQVQLLLEQTSATKVVIEVALLTQSSYWQSLVDAILVVDCSEQTQINRVMQRSNWSKQQVKDFIQKQASRQQRLAIADFVIYNDAISLDELKQQVSKVANSFFNT